MKKVTSRQFQKDFKHITSHLGSGQAIEVTKHGKPVGLFTKSAIRSMPMPDFAANLAEAPYSETEGEQFLNRYLRDSLS